MAAAFRLSERLGVGSAAGSARVLGLLRRLGLPVDVDKYLDERTLSFMGSDKKRKGGKIRFVVPGEPGATQLTPLGLDEIARLVQP
jgi:3-dehydroquinate synthase